MTPSPMVGNSCNGGMGDAYSPTMGLQKGSCDTKGLSSSGTLLAVLNLGLTYEVLTLSWAQAMGRDDGSVYKKSHFIKVASGC